MQVILLKGELGYKERRNKGMGKSESGIKKIYKYNVIMMNIRSTLVFSEKIETLHEYKTPVGKTRRLRKYK